MKVIMRKLLLNCIAGAVAVSVPLFAQKNNDYYRQQQQQQQQRQQDQMRQQQQQQMRDQQRQQMQQQMRDQQRQQMQQQQRDQMQQQQRQQMQQQQRQQQQANQTRQMQDQQRRQLGDAQRAQREGRPAPRGTSAEIVKRSSDRIVFSNGVAKLTRPLTAAEISRGYTGKTTGDGRALVSFRGRVFAVPASGVAVKVNPSQNAGGQQPSRWNDSQRASMHAEINHIAAASLKDKVRTGGSGGLTDRFGRAAGGGAGGGGGASGSGGGGSPPPPPPPSGPGGLTKKFNDAAGVPAGGSKRKTDKPTPDGPPPPTNKPPQPR
jgi:flagellar biosynthesis GTPase FlhF